MKDHHSYGVSMAWIAETYLSVVTRFVRPHGSERYHGVLLHICAHSGCITQKQLGNAMRRDKVTIMRMVDYLCERKLVVRKQNPDDRRSQLLVATQKGLALAPMIYEAYQKTNDVFFKNFSKQEQQVFKKGIDKLMQIVDELPESDFVIRAEERRKR